MKKIFIFSTIVLGMLSCSVFARTPTFQNDAKFSRGVSNCCYYIDSNASSYTSQINAAANNWVDTGYGWNPIYMNAVSSNYATHMDFYSRTPSSDVHLNGDVAGYTTFWDTNSMLVSARGESPRLNYFYTEIVFNASSNGSYDYRTAKHEMGHAFGLDHYDNSYSIMFPSLAGTYVTTVQQCDHDSINYLYN